MPLKDVALLLTGEAILQNLRLTNEALKASGLARTRIAVGAGNPHPGDHGNFGREEIDIIEPAVAAGKAEQIGCEGPFPVCRGDRVHGADSGRQDSEQRDISAVHRLYLGWFDLFLPVFAIVALSIICGAPAWMQISGPKDLVGRIVAVSRGTGADMDATRLARADPKITVVRFEDDATLITALASGQQDIMISATAQMNDINAKTPSRMMQTNFVIRTNGYAVGILKGDDALRTAVNAWIAKDLASGKLRVILKEFHHVDLPEVMPAE